MNGNNAAEAVTNDEVVKDLDYYAAHPGEMPSDEAELEALLSGKTEDKGESGDSAEADAAPGTAAVQTDIEGADVLTKDGKNTIPYGVLKSARERAEGAEKLVVDQAALIEALQSQIANSASAKPELTDAAVIDDPIAEIREDLPSLAKALDKQAETFAQQAKEQAELIRNLQAQVQGLGARAEQEQAEQRRTDEEQVQDAIDANPVLSHWAANNVEMYNLASDMDKTIRAMPTSQDLTFEQRFDKVVKAMVAIHGDSILPPEKPTQDQIRKEAEAVVKNVADAALTTLSDIPGGVAPESSDAQQAENLTAAQLGDKFRSMTEEQRNAYLARL